MSQNEVEVVVHSKEDSILARKDGGKKMEDGEF